MKSKSKFVEANISYLNRNKVVSAYGSTKPYCPSFYWWSRRHSSNDNAQRSFTNDLTRRMRSAGFGSSAINHCIKNSGFIIENNNLTNHPKNKRYDDYVQSAVMVLRDVSSGQDTTIPVLVETNSYTDKKWRIFSEKFAKICQFTTSGKSSVKMHCGPYGNMTGTHENQGNGRFVISVSNSRFKFVTMTRRTPKYVEGRAEKYFK